MESFEATVSDIARRACVTGETVRAYAAAGLVEFRRLQNGMLLLKPSAAATVRQIRDERLAKRGRYPRRSVA